MYRALFACVALIGCSEQRSSGPLDDCQIGANDTMTCPRSLPGCTLQPQQAVQFERCGSRDEYVLYDRAAGCPAVYYYAEGSFLSRADWEAYVGPCTARL